MIKLKQRLKHLLSSRSENKTDKSTNQGKSTNVKDKNVDFFFLINARSALEVFQVIYKILHCQAIPTESPPKSKDWNIVLFFLQNEAFNILLTYQKSANHNHDSTNFKPWSGGPALLICLTQDLRTDNLLTGGNADGSPVLHSRGIRQTGHLLDGWEKEVIRQNGKTIHRSQGDIDL